MRPAKARFTSAISDAKYELRSARLDWLADHGWLVVEHKLPADLRWHEYAPEKRVSTVLDEQDQETAMRLFDHAYRLLHESGAEVHVGEPYATPSIGMPNEAAITRLVADRYEWRMAPGLELHNPGDSRAVYVYEPQDAALVGALLRR